MTNEELADKIVELMNESEGLGATQAAYLRRDILKLLYEYERCLLPENL